MNPKAQMRLNQQQTARHLARNMAQMRTVSARYQDTYQAQVKSSHQRQRDQALRWESDMERQRRMCRQGQVLNDDQGGWLQWLAVIPGLVMLVALLWH